MMVQLSKGNCRNIESIMSRRKGWNYIWRRSTGNANIPSGRRRVLTPSTTKGTPSTSLNLKEALCEKIPLHYDLLRNFRRHHGASVISHITVDNIYQGLHGVSTIIREISELDPKHGIKYRGLTIPEVITLLPRQGQSPCVEAVFWLLLTGDVPAQEQIAWLIADWTTRRQRRKEWWGGPGGGMVGSVLRNLPPDISPLRKMSIALAALDANKHARQAMQNGALSHTHWEYTYEDSMELLASLPAIASLVATGQHSRDVKCEGDWVNFLLDCLFSVSDELGARRKSLGEFLKLYVTLNADDDGGHPGAHVTQILGDSQLDINQALAGGMLAYANEPKTGTLKEYMEFQSKVQSTLGRDPRENVLEDFLTSFVEKERLIGHKETKYTDPRYNALLNYAKQNIPEEPGVKMSQDITRMLRMMKRSKGKYICPEQNAIAAPLFHYYGLKDMEFNQVLLCMSRTFGAIASMIWSRAINSPVEYPKANNTYTYMNLVQGVRKKPKLRKHK